jgi:hypothetical protein
MKLAVDTVSTVPTDPPAAGPDRALDAPPPAAPPWLGPDCAFGAAPPDPPGKPLPCATDAAVADGDVARLMESPITAHRSAAATTHPLILLDSFRHSLGQRSCPAMVAEADAPAGDAGSGGSAAPAPPELPTTSGLDDASGTGRSEGVPAAFVGSYSSMIISILGQLSGRYSGSCIERASRLCELPVGGLWRLSENNGKTMDDDPGQAAAAVAKSSWLLMRM